MPHVGHILALALNVGIAGEPELLFVGKNRPGLLFVGKWCKCALLFPLVLQQVQQMGELAHES